MLGGLFDNKKKVKSDKADDLRDLKIMQSQQILLTAATSAADAANLVTTQIRSKLKDAIGQIESTSRILNDALIICDNSGKIQYTNEIATDMFAQEMLGSDISSFLYCPTCELSGNILDVLASTDQAESNNELFGLRQGTEFPLDINHTRLDRSDGSSIILMVMRDMTPESSNYYKCIFESSFDGIIVVKDKKIVAANPTASKLFGYSKNKLTKKSVENIFIGHDTVEIISDLDEAHEAAAETYHRSGRVMTAFFTSTPISWYGEMATLITIKSLHENVKDGEKLICCFGRDFIISFANNAFCKHYDQFDVIGTDVRDLIPDSEKDTFTIHINGLSENHPTRKMRLFSNKNGKSLVQEWTDHADYLPDGSIQYQRIGSII